MNEPYENIVAVLLTHNRKKMLQEVLSGLFKQTYPIEKIIIIDSLSTDGTYDDLRDKGIIDRSDVEYVRLNENKGPSGGFAEGIKFALKKEPTWIWILDDDISPKEDCLESLIEYRNISQCIAPRREGKTVPFFNPAIGIASHRKSLSFNNDKEYIFSNTCCFEGMLLHQALIDKIGFPDERFFQVYGDTVYGFVASLYTNIIHVKKAFIYRLIPDKKPLSSKRVYLLIRNHFLVREYLKKHEVIHSGFFSVVFILMIFYYATIMAVKTRSISMPFSVIKGLFHGINSKFGAPK